MPAEGEFVMKHLFSTAMCLFFALTLMPVAAEGKQEGQRAGGASEKSLNIVCSTSIVGDVVKHICKPDARVKVLIAPGQNPHAYQPTPKDMAFAEDADLIFVNGLGLEEGLMGVLENLGTGNIVEVSDFVEALHGEDEDGEAHHHHQHHHEGEFDPHTWMSPLNVKLWCDRIVQALSGADPASSDFYQKQGRDYKKSLDELDSKIRKALAGIPVEHRVIVSGHHAFSYMERDYGIRVAGAIIPGFSTAAEPSAKDMAELLALLDEQGVSSLFVAASAGDSIQKLAQALQAEASRPLKVLPFLTGALTAPGGEGDSYIAFMEYNLKQLITGMTL